MPAALAGGCSPASPRRMAPPPRGIAAAFLTRDEGPSPSEDRAAGEGPGECGGGRARPDGCGRGGPRRRLSEGRQAAQLADVVAPGREFGQAWGRGGAAGAGGTGFAGCLARSGIGGPALPVRPVRRGGGGRRARAPPPDGEILTIGEKGITLTFPDEVATLRIGGKLQLDFGASGIRQPGFPEPFPENVAVRRAWIESYLPWPKPMPSRSSTISPTPCADQRRGRRLQGRPGHACSRPAT